MSSLAASAEGEINSNKVRSFAFQNLKNAADRTCASFRNAVEKFKPSHEPQLLTYFKSCVPAL